jgi:hypothetical protein
MKDSGRLLWLFTGILLGAGATALYILPARQAFAANDRFEDYIMCTGAVGVSGKWSALDGVWLLDYRSGKLMATMIDRTQGKLIGWAEADLVNQFGVVPRQNVHFLMTTGSLSQGQAALYVAETSTGKLGVYTMGPRLDGVAGVSIQRHDLVPFRQAPAKGN